VRGAGLLAQIEHCCAWLEPQAPWLLPFRLCL